MWQSHVLKVSKVSCSKAASFNASKFFEEQACVVSAEAKIIAHGVANVALLCLIECEIEFVIDIWVLISLFVIDGRSNYAVLHR